MRDPNRLDNFYNKMTKLHKACFPDQRFGQLMMNFLSWVQGAKNRDPFFSEEDRMMEFFEEYCQEMNYSGWERRDTI